MLRAPCPLRLALVSQSVRFPGQRNPKHYFPVTRRPGTPRSEAAKGSPTVATRGWYLLGLDQVLVDAEVTATPELLAELGLESGESVVLSEEGFARVRSALSSRGSSCRFTPGGTVANTLNNYSFLSGERSILLGATEKTMRFGSADYHYIAQTPPALDLTHLRAVEGPMGTAVTFISDGGERTFAVAPGVANAIGAEDLDADVVQRSAAVVCSLYTLGNPTWPIAGATRRLMALASEAEVPVAFGLGTAGLVARDPLAVQTLLEESVTIVAMNDREAEALTGCADPWLAAERSLEWVDLVVLTMGAEGLIVAGWADESTKRPTRYALRSRGVADFNAWEFSRLVRRADAPNPLKTYCHVHPYKGGPERMVNTNGAGDAALAAILHDVAANRYHQQRVPGSAKHRGEIPFLTYSSLSRSAQYANRVAYEVLRGHSPRLSSPVGSDED